MSKPNEIALRVARDYLELAQIVQRECCDRCDSKIDDLSALIQSAALEMLAPLEKLEAEWRKVAVPLSRQEAIANGAEQETLFRCANDLHDALKEIKG